MATGRTDYPNQVNNVLCFPFIFRGALDVGATEINEAMKVATVEAMATLARVEPARCGGAYGGAAPVFGPEYIIPKPFDPRLILEIAPAVARAAMESGVARRPIADFDAYRGELEVFVFRSGQLMRPVFEAARKQPQRDRLWEGEDERVLRAVQTVAGRGHRRADPDRPPRGDRAPGREMGLRMSRNDSSASSIRRKTVTCSARCCPLISGWSAAAASAGRGGEAAGHALFRGGRPAAGRRTRGCGDRRRHRRLVAAVRPTCCRSSRDGRMSGGLRALAASFCRERRCSSATPIWWSSPAPSRLPR